MMSLALSSTYSSRCCQQRTKTSVVPGTIRRVKLVKNANKQRFVDTDMKSAKGVSVETVATVATVVTAAVALAMFGSMVSCELKGAATGPRPHACA